MSPKMEIVPFWGRIGIYPVYFLIEVIGVILLLSSIPQPMRVGPRDV